MVKKRIRVIVKPQSRETKILQQSEEALTISLRASPQNNKANIELLKFMRKTFKKPVKILSGLKSKEKILEFS